MTIKTMSLALILLSLAAVASAADDADDADDAEALEMDQADLTVKTESSERAKYKDEAPDAPDARRCKNIARTGTRIKTKICATNRQWEEYAQRSAEATEQMQNRPQSGRTID